MESFPVWSPDGSRLVFSRHGRRERNDAGLFVRSLEDGEAEPAGSPGGTLEYANDWSADGRWVVYMTFSAETEADLWLLPMDGGGEPYPRFQTRFSEVLATCSPDSRWLAYTSDQSGRGEIYVALVEGTASGVRVSTEGGIRPRWRSDGAELFYSSADGIVAVPIEYRDGGIVPGSPRTLFSPGREQALDAERIQYEVTADGEQFLVSESSGAASSIHMLLNWVAQPQSN